MALCMERGSNTGERPSLKMRQCQSFDGRTRPAVHFFVGVICIRLTVSRRYRFENF